MSISFKERFKSKLSVMSRLGTIITQTNRAIVLAEPTKLHKNYKHSHTVLKISKKPPSNKESEEVLNRASPENSGYVPYTLKEYKATKPRSYYQLGGLGPIHIGSDNWKIKKNMYSKRYQYGSCANSGNLLRFSKEIVSNKEHVELRKASLKPMSHKRYASAFG